MYVETSCQSEEWPLKRRRKDKMFHNVFYKIYEEGNNQLPSDNKGLQQSKPNTWQNNR